MKNKLFYFKIILLSFFLILNQTSTIYSKDLQFKATEILSFEEGWGVVYMIGLISIGLIGLLADFILTMIFKNKRILNGIGILIAIGFSIMLWIELN